MGVTGAMCRASYRLCVEHHSNYVSFLLQIESRVCSCQYGAAGMRLKRHDTSTVEPQGQRGGSHGQCHETTQTCLNFGYGR